MIARLIVLSLLCLLDSANPGLCIVQARQQYLFVFELVTPLPPSARGIRLGDFLSIVGYGGDICSAFFFACENVRAPLCV